MEAIGLIAGNRKFPLLVAQGARREGCRVTALAIKGETSPRLKSLVDKIYWIALRDFSRMFDIFKQEGITRAVMAGQVSPHRIFSREVQQDELLRSLLENISNKKADTIFAAIARKLQEAGITLLDSSRYVKEHLPDKGVLTRRQPDAALWEDIHFGFELAKAVGGLDIGQTVAVRNKAIVAVEAFEGTDNLIRRAGVLARGGITVVKVSKPNQDMRFDIPVVGLKTIKSLIAAGARCLALEAKKTLFIDRQESLACADKRKLVVVAV